MKTMRHLMIAPLIAFATAAAGSAVPGAEIDALFAEWDTGDTPGCSVAVARDGERVYSRAYGLADLEQATPNTTETIFHVASVSKQFTAFAIMLLEADGRLSLDDEIQTHLPELADFGVPVRIHHLMHHVSGVRDQWELLTMSEWRSDDVITMDDIWGLAIRQRELSFTPGEQYMYSNMGYTLLAFIVERASGISFPEFCKQRIFEPLGMERTHFHVDHQHLVPQRSYSYAKSGDTWRKSVLSYANVGATSLFTTPEDLLKWLENYYTAEVGGDAVIAKMKTPGLFNSGLTTNYGGGVSLGKYKGHQVIAHGGADAAFRSYVITFPDEHLSIAVTSNLASFNSGGQALKIADLFLEDTAPKADEDESEIDRDVLRAVRGTYINPMTGATVALASRRDHLHINSSGFSFQLAQRGENEFVTAVYPEHMNIRVHTDASGDATKLDITMPGSPMAAYVRTVSRPANPFYPLQFAGTYYSPELDVNWHVVIDDGHLALKRRKYGVSRLQTIFTDGYGAGGYRLYFTRDRDGHVDGMRVSSGRVTGLKFERLGD